MADQDYGALKRPALLELIKARALPANGKNADLVERLRADDFARAEADRLEEENARQAAALQQAAEEAARPVKKAQKVRRGPARRINLEVDPEADSWQDGNEGESEEEFAEFRSPVRRKAQGGVAGMTVDQLREIMAQESQRAMRHAVGDVNVIMAESGFRQEAVSRWKDITFNSRSDFEYDVLKSAGRELFVLSKTVDDPVVAAKIAKINGKLEERAVTLFIGENIGWATADSSIIPEGSLFKDHERRIEKAREDGKKRKLEEPAAVRASKPWPVAAVPNVMTPTWREGSQRIR